MIARFIIMAVVKSWRCGEGGKARDCVQVVFRVGFSDEPIDDIIHTMICTFQGW